jgi:hypothetical protein
MTNVTHPPSSSNTVYGIKKSPNRLRLAQVGLGAISIILSIVVLTFSDVAIYYSDQVCNRRPIPHA